VRGVEQIPWLYDAYMALMDAVGLRQWRRWLVQGTVGRTLDLGCGTGRNLRLFPERADVVGLELDLRMAHRARRRAPARPLVVASAESLPFKGATFQTVVSSLVFCSVTDPSEGLLEVHRVLAADGKLRMLEHVRSAWAPVARLQDLTQPLWTAVSGGCHPNRETELTVTQAGFSIDASSRRARGSMRCFTARPDVGDSTR
jgi:ubiquinone/menaquinone biosynthesis C-methylase UbiE